MELNKEVNVRDPSGSSRAKTLRKMRDAKERGDTYYDNHTVRDEEDGGRSIVGFPRVSVPQLQFIVRMERGIHVSEVVRCLAVRQEIRVLQHLVTPSNSPIDVSWLH